MIYIETLDAVVRQSPQLLALARLRVMQNTEALLYADVAIMMPVIIARYRAVESVLFRLADRRAE